MIEVNWNPDRRSLRWFGLICLFAFGLLGTWVHFRHSILFWDLSPAAARLVARGLWVLSAVGGTAAALAPRALLPLYTGLTLISFPIGYVVSHVVLALFFYGVFLPIGLSLRLLGKDPLTRKFEPDAESYWSVRRPVESVRRYYHQF